MKSLKSKDDLIETVLYQMQVDVDCQDYTALHVFLNSLPIDNVINYLPEEYWARFKHLRELDYEIRTENTIKNLINKYPNDADLGKEIRKRWHNYTKQ